MTRTVKIYIDSENKDSVEFRSYEIDDSVTGKMTVMDLLRFMGGNYAPDLYYYDHSSCGRGLCGRCALKLNGTVCLACVTPVPESGTITLEPVSEKKRTFGPAVPSIP